MTGADTPQPLELRVALLGNTNPEVYWATEMEYADAYERAGCDVFLYREDQPADWDRLIKALRSPNQFDFVHWTRTKAFADKVGDAKQWELIAACRRAGVPLVGVHLDQFLALPRRHRQVENDPYFRGVDIFFNVDDGHADLWRDMGVNHRWLLPAISERWLGLGEVRPEHECDIAFVGSWEGGYHKEFAHRHELVAHLAKRWGDHVKFFPARGQPRIVGRDLNDLYRSAKIVIGDAFHVPGSGGAPLPRTGSDRTPETLGRGGNLLTPRVPGWNSDLGDPFYGGAYTWEMWDWVDLDEAIDSLLSMPVDEAMEGRRGNVDWTISNHHSYTDRVRTIVAELNEEGLL